ncbi:hypothetical protein B0H14DRAFT_2633781 [Mycena olivaceomarginata]|nr:hypothetical protein B0H14DRAFT_2633781 [Mycena olivaceomarginata]
MAHEAMAKANHRFSVKRHTEPGFEHLDTFEHQMSTNHTIDNETSLQWQDAMPVSVSLSPSLPVADGPSHNKGKGPDPCNWGPVGSLVDFSEQELEAQRDAFRNFTEINRVVKQEKRAKSTLHVHVPNVGLKPPIKILKVNRTVSKPLPENKGTTKPGQADAEWIAELEREFSQLRQSDLLKRTMLIPPSSEAKCTIEQNIADAICCGNTARNQAQRLERQHQVELLLEASWTKPSVVLQG